MPDLNPFATANYLVPLDGTTHALVAAFVASATPKKFDWRAFSNDNFSFFPQGAYVDNTGGINDLVIEIEPIGFSVTIAAGKSRKVSWPAPKNQITSVTGNGAVKIYFVNYPIFDTPSELDGVVDVNLDPSATVTISGQPISTVAENQAWNGADAAWESLLNSLPADGQAALKGLATTAQMMAWNGSSFDRMVNTPNASGFGAQPSALMVSALGYVYNAAGGDWGQLSGMNTTDGVALPGFLAAHVTQGYLWGGVRDTVKLRTPIVFNTAKLTAAGSTAIWTPASGNTFRLMRYKIDATGDAIAAAAGDLDLIFYDGATAMPIGEDAYIPAAVSGVAWSSGWVDLGNGILSAAADNVLNLNLGFALTGGLIRVTVCGTEE